MAGDAEKQPAEGVVSLSDLAAEMDSTAEDQEESGEQVEGEDDEAEAGDNVEETEEEEESEEQSGDDSTVTLKVDGKEVVIKQSEAIELAQKGLDYTNKTMVVAEERKAAEAAKAQAETYREDAERNRQETISRLEAYSEFMESQVGSPPPISLAAENTQQYLILKEQYEARKGQLQQANAAVVNLREESQRARQDWIAQQADETEKALKDTLPGWNDAMLQDLAGYMAEKGINPKTADIAFVQRGIWELAHKAKAYDALQAEKAKLKPKANLPKVQKPSAANHPNRSDSKRAEAEKRYQASPSLNTLSALIE